MGARDVVIVTGASGGIGGAVAAALARRGSVVVATGRDEARLAALAHAAGGSFVAADLRDPGSAARVVDHALTTHGRLDAVVACAGVGHFGPFRDMAPDRVRELVDVDLLAPVLLARAALPSMLRQQRGAVVFVSSIAGAVGVPGEAVYSSAKAGLAMFAAVLREESRGSGVTVSTIVPGAVGTGFFDRRGRPYDRRFPRLISAERVAAAVLRAVETGVATRTEPRWLALPARLAATAPSAYRALARRLG